MKKHCLNIARRTILQIALHVKVTKQLFTRTSHEKISREKKQEEIECRSSRCVKPIDRQTRRGYSPEELIYL